MPQTTTYGITYPSGSTAPNVPLAMQSTAESVESAFTTIQASSTANVSLGGLYQHYTSSGAYGAPKYTRAFNKQVSTTGMVGTTGTQITMLANTQYLIGTLPAGFRPAYDQMFVPPTAAAMGGKGTIYIRANGDIHFENSAAFTNLAKGSFFIALDGFTWQAL